MNLPLSTDPAKNVAIRGGVWNRLVTLVARLANVTAQWPLSVLNTPQGIHIGFDHPVQQFSKAKIVGPVEGQSGRYLAREIVNMSDPAATARIAAADLGNEQDETYCEVWNLAESAAWSPPLQAGQLVWGWVDATRTVEDNQRRILLVCREPGSMIGEVVCGGPQGQDDFSDNRQWVQVKGISAPCDPETPWSLADAPPISDPCQTEGGATIPHIVAAFNIGAAVSQAHMQPGKLVLLTPLLTADASCIRYACEYIDPTDNGQDCGGSSSSSESSSDSSSSSSASPPDNHCWVRWFVDFDCTAETFTEILGPLDTSCDLSEAHADGIWFCSGAGANPGSKRLSVWVDLGLHNCFINDDCGEAAGEATPPGLPTIDQARACCSSSDSNGSSDTDPSGSGGFTGDRTVVTAWNAETCEVTTETWTFMDGRLVGVA